MRISDWSSDVCSSDLGHARHPRLHRPGGRLLGRRPAPGKVPGAMTGWRRIIRARGATDTRRRSRSDTVGIVGRVARDETGDAAVQIAPAVVERKRGAEGKGVSVRVEPGGRRILQQKKT